MPKELPNYRAADRSFALFHSVHTELELEAKWNWTCTQVLAWKPSSPGLPWMSRSRVALVPYLAYASIVSSGQRKGGFLHAKSAGNQFAVDVANAAKIVVRCIAQHISRFRVLGALTLRG